MIPVFHMAHMQALTQTFEMEVQIFSYSVKGVQMLMKSELGAKIRCVVWGQNLHEYILHSHV